MFAKNLTLSQAIEGMLFYKKASGKSPNTVENYRIQLVKLTTFLPDDPPFTSITRDQLIAFFAWLRDGYISEPNRRIPHPEVKLSAKSLFNIHASLSALWSWAVEEGLVEKNLARTIKPPKVNDPVIEPFTKEQIKAMLKACDRSANWKERGSTSNERPTAERDHAIILVLLDTGVRAQELCDIKLGELNLSGNNIRITGKGSKERIVYFGKRTAKALWKYLLPRLNTQKPDDYLFLVGFPNDPHQMERTGLHTLVNRIGKRAGVADVFPHRFRHTFAITYLRNQGDVFTLQNLLGHSDLDMVRRYARIAQTDCARVHQTASPVDNWKL
jgi:integrase/recombinase XerD